MLPLRLPNPTTTTPPGALLSQASTTRFPHIYHSPPPSIRLSSRPLLGILAASPPRVRIASRFLRSGIAMDRLNASPRLMIVSDLDHTMVDHHDKENLSLLRFNALWESSYRHDSLLVFSTGRSPTLYKELRKEKPMLTPDITIMSVGTEITYGEEMVPDDGWEAELNRKWDRKIVEEETSKFPQLTLQSYTEQRPHKVSFYVQKGQAEELMKSLYQRLGEHGLDVKIIYSGGQDLDILPKGAGKGQALAYLLKKLKADGKPPVNTLACGDSGNDAELFTIPDVHGVMVQNAQEELLKWHAENAKSNPMIIHASERCAAGIIQAIGHFNLGPNISPRDILDLSSHKLEAFSPGLEVVKFYLLYERWRRAEIERSVILYIKECSHPEGVVIHPSGVEQSLFKSLYALDECYGDKKSKDYRVWVDKLSSSQIGANTWLVKFNKWELIDGKQQGCLTTVLLNSKPECSNGFTLVHVHQTWLANGLAPTSEAGWIL